MASAWMARRSGPKIPFLRRSRAGNIIPSADPPTIPTHFRCPISLDLMRDPVTLPTGITYDRQSIETWLELGNRTCPVTNQPIPGGEELIVIPNHSIRKMIQDWCVANRSFGVERIPTPRIPVTPAQASDLLSEIASAGRRGDGARCAQLVAKIRASAKESERNHRCIAGAGASRVLSAAFSQLAPSPEASEEILSALAGFRPLDEEASWILGSPESLRQLASVLRHGNLAGRLNAALVMKEVVSSPNTPRLDAAAETEGLLEALVKLVEKPISPQATKASLVTIFYLVSSSERAASRLVEMGLVSLLLEILVDSEKGMCEKALAVLDGALDCERGREMAYAHALTVPVLVKKMFRVSDAATGFAVSALWKLCGGGDKREGGGGGEGCSVEALQAGAFQKLLLLLQIGCSGETKEKTSELLKLLNGLRGRLECIESVDFKGLKRPF